MFYLSRIRGVCISSQLSLRGHVLFFGAFGVFCLLNGAGKRRYAFFRCSACRPQTDGGGAYSLLRDLSARFAAVGGDRDGDQAIGFSACGAGQFSANLAFLGNGALLLGVFNILFFPLYFSAPHKVGAPFLLAGAAQFLLVAVLIALRFSVPFWRDLLTAPDPAYLGAKLAVFFTGVVLYAVLTALSLFLSVKKFERIDL